MRQLLFITLFLIAGVLQAQWGMLFGWRADFVIATLVTLAFFMTSRETLVLSVVAVWWLAWRPDVTREMMLIVAFTILWSQASRYIPIHTVALHIGAVISSIALFYALSGSWKFIAMKGVFFMDIITSLAYALAVYFALRRTYEPSGKGRMTLFGQLLHEGRRNRI